MKQAIIQAELDALSKAPGVNACAMADSSSRLVLHPVGEYPANEPVWEAATNYWRTYFRGKPHFDGASGFGSLHAIATCHTNATLVLLPCPTQADGVVVCVASGKGVHWSDWQRRVRRLDQRLQGTAAQPGH